MSSALLCPRSDLDAPGDDCTILLALIAALIHTLSVSGLVDLEVVRRIAVLELFRLVVDEADSPECHGQLRLPFKEVDDDGGTTPEVPVSV